MRCDFCNSGTWGGEELIKVKIPWYNDFGQRKLDEWKICSECWDAMLLNGGLEDIEDFIPRRVQHA